MRRSAALLLVNADNDDYGADGAPKDAGAKGRQSQSRILLPVYRRNNPLPLSAASTANLVPMIGLSCCEDGVSQGAACHRNNAFSGPKSQSDARRNTEYPSSALIETDDSGS